MLFTPPTLLRRLPRMASIFHLPTSPAAITRSFTSIPNTLSSRPRIPRILSAPLLSQQQAQMRGMKVRSSVKKLCDGCMSVRRKNRVYIICSKNQKHKQRQG